MDADRFKKVFLPFYPKLFRIAYALIGNKSEAEDIVQDVYYKLWSKRKESENIRSAEAFCITLVRNACIDRLRRLQQEGVPVEITETTHLPKIPAPDQRLEMQEILSRIHDLIALLPENQRQVLRLRGIEDCSPEEIEQITGFSASNIRVLLSRARKFLREQLEFLNSRDQI